LQDKGRFGFMRFGVTESGPMDRVGHAIACDAVDTSGPAMEVSLGGLTLRCLSGDISLAVAGGSFSVLLDGHLQPAWSVFTIHAGSKLQIRSGDWGSWCYLAFAGEVETPEWLGSRSTHMDTGLCGMPFKQGDQITVNSARTWPDRLGEITQAEVLRPSDTVRVVLGPQDRFFPAQSIEDLTTKPFKITPEYNRMGMRLSGPKFEINQALDMPSEPIARGSLQVPGHGDPLCLLADHGTAGGYPKIATVVTADLDAMVQLRAGDQVKFKAVSVEEAVKATRQKAATLEALAEKIKAARVSLEQRLWNNNLISGFYADEPD
jgi:biotin-dependent carboxylase-like uncharacterized protein